MGKKNTIEDIRKRVSEISTAELVSTEYINCMSKLRFRCSCGKEFEASWNKFLGGQTRCNDCAKAEQYSDKRLSLEEVKKRIAEKGGEYVSGEYVNQDSVLNVRCSVCGEVFSRVADFVFRNVTCPRCAHKKRINDQTYTIEKAREICKSRGVELLSTKYNNAHERLKVKCSCGRIFYSNLNNISTRQYARCRACARQESYGEVRIRKWLENNGIPFEQEKRFADCGGKRPYPFDFYLPGQNLCIELDGEQHFDERLPFWSPSIAEHDIYKSKYCLDHGIGLLRIRYMARDQIEALLDMTIPR